MGSRLRIYEAKLGILESIARGAITIPTETDESDESSESLFDRSFCPCTINTSVNYFNFSADEVVIEQGLLFLRYSWKNSRERLMMMITPLSKDPDEDLPVFKKDFTELIGAVKPAFLQRINYGQKYLPKSKTLCFHQMVCEYTKRSLATGTYRYMVIGRFRIDLMADQATEVSTTKVCLDTLTGTQMKINPQSRNPKAKFHSSFPIVRRRIFSLFVPTYEKLICVAHCFWLGRWVPVGVQQRNAPLFANYLGPDFEHPLSGLYVSGTGLFLVPSRDLHPSSELLVGEMKRMTEHGWEYAVSRLILR